MEKLGNGKSSSKSKSSSKLKPKPKSKSKDKKGKNRHDKGKTINGKVPQPTIKKHKDEIPNDKSKRSKKDGKN